MWTAYEMKGHKILFILWEVFHELPSNYSNNDHCWWSSLCAGLALAQGISTTTPRVPLQETIGGQTKPEVVHTATVPHEPRGGHENPIVRYLT